LLPCYVILSYGMDLQGNEARENMVIHGIRGWNAIEPGPYRSTDAFNTYFIPIVFLKAFFADTLYSRG